MKFTTTMQELMLEKFEIAGYAGIDLTGWSFIPYNGTDGKSYTPIINLSGIITDQLNGYGTVLALSKFTKWLSRRSSISKQVVK
jgi:hypothetical protein